MRKDALQNRVMCVESGEGRTCRRMQGKGLWVLVLLVLFSLDIWKESTAAEVGSQAKAPMSFAELQKEALEGGEPALRIAALKRLFQEHDEAKTLPVLIMALRDKDVGVRAVSLQLMEQLNKEPLPLGLIAELSRTDPSPHLRVHAFLVLSDRGPEVASEPLQRGLQDPDPYVRERVEEILEDMGLKPRDPQKAEKEMSPEDLERFKVAAIKRGLMPSLRERALHDPDPQVRERIQKLLKKLDELPAKDAEKGNQELEKVISQ